MLSAALATVNVFHKIYDTNSLLKQPSLRWGSVILPALEQGTVLIGK